MNSLQKPVTIAVTGPRGLTLALLLHQRNIPARKNVHANRGEGPDVISAEEFEAISSGYKKLAGFDLKQVNRK